MEKEIKELEELFMKEVSGHYSQAECHLFAKLAVEGGYKFKKCFNADHNKIIKQ